MKRWRALWAILSSVLKKHPSGCDLLLLCNEPEGLVQVLDGLKYQPTQAQKERRLSLMKTQNRDLARAGKQLSLPTNSG
ncbi:Uncharacterised protein [Mannheimia haemolytica]|uniref:Uncharacterized protein n=1 Tax=Mannheimia haemolytica TaxID=75985 RepID=A0A378MX08_MANHA|nr:Uncharacterised protein [Mannheimia haemolytica]